MQNQIKKIRICGNNGPQRKLTMAETIIIQFDVDKKEINEWKLYYKYTWKAVDIHENNFSKIEMKMEILLNGKLVTH